MLKKMLTLIALVSAFPAFAGWEYDTQIDQMTSKQTRRASVTSTNSLNLGFPYSGNNHGTVTVRQHPKHGLDVIVRVDKGQIMCTSFSGCPIHVRFDDAAPLKLEGNPSADHDSTVVFLRGPQKFITAASKAKRILVQFNMFQSGAPVLTFDTPAPLQWSAPKKKSP